VRWALPIRSSPRSPCCAACRSPPRSRRAISILESIRIAELMPIPGHRHPRTLPADLNKTIVYARAQNYGQQPDATMELVKRLALPSSVPGMKNKGMDPA
jgi:hypothetical protein